MLSQQYMTGRHKEALAGMKQIMPELFEKPPKLTSNFPGDTVMAGSILLLRAGDCTSPRKGACASASSTQGGVALGDRIRCPAAAQAAAFQPPTQSAGRQPGQEPRPARAR